jgi:hypothetical protein
VVRDGQCSGPGPVRFGSVRSGQFRLRSVGHHYGDGSYLTSDSAEWEHAVMVGEGEWRRKTKKVHSTYSSERTLDQRVKRTTRMVQGTGKGSKHPIQGREYVDEMRWLHVYIHVLL